MRLAAAVPTAILLLGCQGDLQVNIDGIPVSAGAAPLRRLTRLEYDNTVRDLFGVEGAPSASWPGESGGTGFSTDIAGQGATADLVEQTMRSAEATAEQVLGRLGTLHPCALEPDVDAAGCGASFIERFGRAAYRRPLTDEDREELRGVLDAALARGPLVDALRLVTTALLLSPHFLYRPELGGSPVVSGGRSLVRLSDHEIATRLSYAFTSSAPDAELLAAADAETLHTEAQVAGHALRLLSGARGRAITEHFFSEWLRLDRLDNAVKRPDLFPSFTATLRQTMKAGTLAFWDHVLFDSSDGRLTELLNARYAFVNEETAASWGLPGELGPTLQRLPVAEPRSGILTDVGLMTLLAGPEQTSPVARGLLVYQDLLCQHVSPPPPDVNVEVPPPDPTLTTRERFAAHRSSPACASCHQYFDPPGFALETYDAIGRYRSSENELPIDARGRLQIGQQSFEFEGAQQLAELLSTGPWVHDCLARKWFAFVMGRRDGSGDELSIAALAERSRSGRIRELLAEISVVGSFTHRKAVPVPECAP